MTGSKATIDDVLNHVVNKLGMHAMAAKLAIDQCPESSYEKILQATTDAEMWQAMGR